VRKALCQALVAQAPRPDFVFLTGDLGFQALEPVRDAMGPRFINAGVAEQNMVSVAAGLARQQLRPWVYSIAPFLYARPFEQIRNDVCFHSLPVVLVGNGGGYGYGVMGSTHHALEDYGILLTLAGMQVHIPAFDADMPTVIEQLFTTTNPAYLRLGLSEEPRQYTPAPYASWRKLVTGPAGTIVAVGPLAGSYWQPCAELGDACRPNLWCLSELPLGELPAELLDDVRRSEWLCVAEEHVAQGGVGPMLTTALLTQGCPPRRLVHRPALGYPTGRYGSQKFHRRECRLDAESLLQDLIGSADTR
jgi:transketolase